MATQNQNAVSLSTAIQVVVIIASVVGTFSILREDMVKVKDDLKAIQGDFKELRTKGEQSERNQLRIEYKLETLEQRINSTSGYKP